MCVCVCLCVCVCVCARSCPHVGVSMTTSRASTVWDTSCESRSPCPPDSEEPLYVNVSPPLSWGHPEGTRTDPERFEDQVGGGDKAKDVESHSPFITSSTLDYDWAQSSVFSFRHPANVYLVLLCIVIYHSWWLSIGSPAIGSQFPTCSFRQ